MTSLSESPAEVIEVASAPTKRRGRPPGSKNKTAVKRAVTVKKPAAKKTAKVKDDPIHPSFEPLSDVLRAAYLQAAIGKGRQRHGGTVPLMEQPWLQIARASGPGFLTGQATKKLMEAAKMRSKPSHDPSAYERELLGAMVYSAFAILFERKGVGNAD